MGYLAIAIICLFAGGFGGYTWGRKAEAKAQAIANALKQSANNIGNAIKK